MRRISSFTTAQATYGPCSRCLSYMPRLMPFELPVFAARAVDVHSRFGRFGAVEGHGGALWNCRVGGAAVEGHHGTRWTSSRGPASARGGAAEAPGWRTRRRTMAASAQGASVEAMQRCARRSSLEQRRHNGRGPATVREKQQRRAMSACEAQQQRPGVGQGGSNQPAILMLAGPKSSTNQQWGNVCMVWKERSSRERCLCTSMASSPLHPPEPLTIKVSMFVNMTSVLSKTTRRVQSLVLGDWAGRFGWMAWKSYNSHIFNRKEMSAYYLEHANVDHIQKHFDDFEEEARSLLSLGLPIPVYILSLLGYLLSTVKN